MFFELLVADVVYKSLDFREACEMFRMKIKEIE